MYILELGQCAGCLNRRPLSHYNLDTSFSDPEGLLGDFFNGVRSLLKLEFHGDVPAHSNSGHIPQACKDSSQVSCDFLHTPEVQNRCSAKFYLCHQETQNKDCIIHGNCFWIFLRVDISEIYMVLLGANWPVALTKSVKNILQL